jgi:hypothetical protein
MATAGQAGDAVRAPQNRAHKTDFAALAVLGILDSAEDRRLSLC